MIRVTIELIPHGDETRKKVIGRGIIINDGTGNWESGNYHGWFSRVGGRIESFEVKGFPRKRLGCWNLLFRALKGVGGTTL